MRALEKLFVSLYVEFGRLGIAERGKGRRQL